MRQRSRPQRAEHRHPGEHRAHPERPPATQPLAEHEVRAQRRETADLGGEHGGHRDPVPGARRVGVETEDLAHAGGHNQRERTPGDLEAAGERQRQGEGERPDRSRGARDPG